MGDLVCGLGGWQPGPDIHELADPGLPSQVLHRPGQEVTVCPRTGGYLRPAVQHFLSHPPVSLVVVLAAQPVGVHAGWMRHRRVKTRRSRAGRVGC